MKIGVFDSGKGGTTVLAAIRERLPNAEYRYIADSENCPYGEKSQEELERIVISNVEGLLMWGAEIIVIACNTATTRCIGMLRRKYPRVCFVGVEPAIRQALKTGVRKVLVMATPATIEAERTHELMAENRGDNQEVILLACPGLAKAIEDDGDIDAVLAQNLAGVRDDYDCIVLGCTHYPLIRNKIQRYFKNAQIIDGNDGVAREVAKLAAQKVPS